MTRLFRVALSRADAMRLDRIAARYPNKHEAARAIGIGEVTLENAREMGLMQEKTRLRIVKTLDEMEGCCGHST